MVLPGRSLEVGPSQFISQRLTLMIRDLPGTQQVALVSHDDDGDVAAGMDSAHMLVERLDGTVAVEVSDREDEHITICPVNGAIDLLLTVKTLCIILERENCCSYSNYINIFCTFSCFFFLNLFKAAFI